ncbi:MAG: hypothetical protein HY820_10980 [Acidobacteria bacterium]|nr:hypothetical protein [Acidobacteriota bacterium]
MAGYISSNNNRHYVNTEAGFGEIPTITSNHRFLASSVQVRQEHIQPKRKDKTGSRSVDAVAGQLRRATAFQVKNYLTARNAPGDAPAYGPLLEATLGGTVRQFSGGTVDALLSPTSVRLTTPHTLSMGDAIGFGGEIRFVTSVVDAQTVDINSPFTIQPSAGSPMGATVSYGLGSNLKSVSLFDYWSPEAAVQRIVSGAVVDRLKVDLNGDLHEMEFRGHAADLVDTASFNPGLGQLSDYPVEPALAAFAEAPVPGHLGQAWIGAGSDQMFTITDASVILDNNIDMRNREFGSAIPKGFAAGKRAVSIQLSLYGQDDSVTTALYTAAKDRTPITVMLQLGEQAGQLMGIFMKNVIPSIPEFDDRETRLQWRFDGCLAHGANDDEMHIAFG